jgi:hypothetical protein
MRSKIRHGGSHAARPFRWATGLMLLAGLLSGCTSPSDDGTEVGIVEGSIGGVVTDSRGNPIEGAVVSYAEPNGNGTTTQTAATAADGSFSFDSVGISAVSGTSGNDLNGPITLQITSSSQVRTLDATVSISPAAQANNADLFGEDFIVNVGTIPVPALDKSVQGTLRDVNSGSVLAGQTVHLTWKGIEFQPSLSTGISVDYGLSENQSLISDSAGGISFNSAVNDSCLEFLVNNLAVTSISGSSASCSAGTVQTRDPNALYIATSTTPTTVSLGSIYLSGYTDSDTIAPYVTGVTGTLDASVSPAPLSSTINGISPNGIVVQFSEPMTAAISSSDVVVSYGSGTQTVAGIASITLTNNSLLTINLTSALPAGTNVSVKLSREAFADLAGNPLGLSRDIAYDSLTGSSDQTLQLSLATASSFDTVPPYVRGVDGVADATTSPAELSSDVTGQAPNELVVRFSETLGIAPATEDVQVLLGSGSGATVATISSVSMSDSDSALHISLRNALPSGTAVTIHLARDAIADESDNGVALNAAIAYDAFTGSTSDTLTLYLVTPAATTDNQSPKLTGVDGIESAITNPALLSPDITGVAPHELVLRFDEAMAPFANASNVSIVLGSGPTATLASIASVGYADSNTSIHISLRSALPSSVPVTISIPTTVLVDASGNAVAENPSIAYDAITGSTSDTFTLYLQSAVGDLASPYVSEVKGVTSSPNVTPAILDPAVNGIEPNEFVIVFNEPMLGPVSPSSVQVTYGRLGRPATVAGVSLQNNATELHVALDQPIAANVAVTLQLTRSGVTDLAGNAVGLNDAIAYDALTGSSEDTVSIYLITSAD